MGTQIALISSFPVKYVVFVISNQKTKNGLT